MILTASDMARFGIELMLAYKMRSDRLLSQSTARAMFAETRRVDDLCPLGFLFGQGLGVFLTGEGEHLIAFHPGGNDPGAASLLCLQPESGKGTAILANGARGFQLCIEVLTAVARSYGW